MTEVHLQALFQGKKLILNYTGFPTVILYPPNYGVFMTYEKYEKLVYQAKVEGMETVVKLLDEIRNSHEK
jgi:hypothetical protein